MPCIGRRPDPAATRTVIYAGQRRLLAAQASEHLAGTVGLEQLAPVRSLIVLLLDHEPSDDEIRRIQAQENRARSSPSPTSRTSSRDCWQARAGLPDEDRIAAVCADLGIGARRAHNLLRQLTLPEPIRSRVAERPGGDQLSVTMANQLADMHEIAPELTLAVAERITTTDLHEKALRDLGAFVHRTVVENEHTYAVRIDDGALLDAADQIEHARAHLTPAAQQQAARMLGCALAELDGELDTLDRPRQDARRSSSASTARCATAPAPAATPTSTTAAATSPPASGSSTRCSCSTSSASTSSTPTTTRPATRRYFAGARLDDDELRAAAEQDREHRAEQRARHADAFTANLGLGHDLRAGLIDPSDAQLHALKAVVCHLLARHYRDVIAYGAGWTDPDRQQPVGDTGRHEPRQIDAIVDAELQRALDDPDPLRGIAQLVTRWGAAFLLDPDGVTRTKALGSERMARKLRDALPGGEHPLRAAAWELMRPMLSPRLAALHRDAFITDSATETTVDLAAHRSDSSLDDLDLDHDAEPD